MRFPGDGFFGAETLASEAVMIHPEEAVTKRRNTRNKCKDDNGGKIFLWSQVYTLKPTVFALSAFS